MANRLVYHATWFYLVQLGIVTAVIFAVLDRIPFRKKLTGFYIVHAGLVTISLGSVITHYWGIDGSIEVAPKTFTSSASLNQDTLYLASGQKEAKLTLPNNLLETSMGDHLRLDDNTRATVLKLLPFAKESRTLDAYPGGWVNKWKITNPRVTQEFELTNLNSPHVQKSFEMGKLSVRTVSFPEWKALEKALPDAKYEYIFLNLTSGNAVPLLN